MSFRWGIAGPGTIAAAFAATLTVVPDAELVAVGSRRRETADAFADKTGIQRRYGSYEELAGDDDIDLVYVASPHSRHHEHTQLFLKAGKGVLCEKPFALDAAQAGEMVSTAREHGQFLMEAMWSRFLPAYVRVRELVADGAIGTIVSVEADFGFPMPVTPSHRLFDPALGGGALLDLGVYPVSLAGMLLGEPDRVAAVGRLGETGVDEHVSVLTGYADGAVAVATASLRARLACAGRITGTEGHIQLPAMMHCPNELVLHQHGKDERLHLPATKEEAPTAGGLFHQVNHVHDRLRAGHRESDVMPMDESVSVMRTLDAARAQIGLSYPGR